MARFDRRAFLGAGATALGSVALISDAASVDERVSGRESAAVGGPAASLAAETTTPRQYQSDAANTGSTSAQGPGRYLETEWFFDDAAYYGVRSSPALVDGTLYFASAESGLGDGGSGFVHAVDASDGTENWRVKTNARGWSTPAVADGRVIVGDGALVALDAADGTELWRADRQTPTSPTVADGTVYASTGDADRGVEFAAFDASDGSVKWTVDVPSEDYRTDKSTPAVAGGTVYVAAALGDYYSRRGALFALSADTGEQQWRAEFPELSGEEPRMTVTPPVVAGDTVYVSAGESHNLHAYDAATGEERWSVRTTRTPTVADGTVYALGGPSPNETENGRVVALDPETGEVQWSTYADPEDEAQDASIVSEVGVAGDTLYVGTNDDGLWALDANSGEILDRILGDQRGYVWSPPAVAGDTAYVPTYSSDYDAGVYAVVAGEPPSEEIPPPEVEFVDQRGPTYCTGEEVWFHREAEEPDADTIEERDYAWRLDFDTSDDQTQDWSQDVTTVGEVVHHTYEESGTYEAALTLRDPEGRTDTETITVEIVACPTARIQTDPPNAGERDLETGTTVTLDASSSTDSNGEVVAYEWDVGDDGTYDETGPTIDVELAFCGVLPVKLRVTDDDGLTDTERVVLSTIR